MSVRARLEDAIAIIEEQKQVLNEQRDLINSLRLQIAMMEVVRDRRLCSCGAYVEQL
jgi:hypothetical protein